MAPPNSGFVCLLAYFLRADVGYGYSPDGGVTFPVRGLGIGLIPTLREILEVFPGKRFALNDKDSNAASVELLATT